ncbi:MAG: DUF5058 family protein [Mogibacterium sp.]|nr:DUF5058 family protein [Mogibacterium sp.]
MKAIANSPLMFALVAIGLAYIVFLSIAFYRRAYKRCLELGITKETMKDVIKSSAIFSVVPSLSIVVGLFALVAVFQSVIWPWWRLSVIGSLSYEVQISGLLASSFGVSLVDMSPEQFGAVLILMSVGMLSGFLILIPFGKKLCMSVAKTETTSDWRHVFSGVFLLTLFAVFIPLLLIGDTIQALVMITGLIVAIILGVIASKPKMGWLNNFILAITMIVGMASSVFWVGLFK